MTPSSARSWSSTVASLRKASDGCLAGGREAFGHFEQYVNLLFCLTVAHKDAAIRLSRPAATSNVWVPERRQCRLVLADEFGVPTNAPHEVWRTAVAEHEAKAGRLFDL